MVALSLEWRKVVCAGHASGSLNSAAAEPHPRETARLQIAPETGPRRPRNGRNLAWGNAVDAHVRAQSLGHSDGTIRLLIILHHRDPGPSHGQSRPIQCVNELAFTTGFRLETDAGATRLERFTVRTRGNLPELAACRQPDF